MKLFVSISSILLFLFFADIAAQGVGDGYRLSLASERALSGAAAMELEIDKRVTSALHSLKEPAPQYASISLLRSPRLQLTGFSRNDAADGAYRLHMRRALLPDNGQPAEQFYESTLFQVLLGGIVVLGGVSAYFKLKADDYYDDYRRTGDESLLDKTDAYDTISGISFGLLQVNFGFLIYKFLVEE